MVGVSILLKEIQQYRWQQDRVSGQYLDTPVTVNDDCIAALRYGIEQWRKNKEVKDYEERRVEFMIVYGAKGSGHAYYY